MEVDRLLTILKSTLISLASSSLYNSKIHGIEALFAVKTAKDATHSFGLREKITPVHGDENWKKASVEEVDKEFKQFSVILKNSLQSLCKSFSLPDPVASINALIILHKPDHCHLVVNLNEELGSKFKPVSSDGFKEPEGKRQIKPVSFSLKEPADKRNVLSGKSSTHGSKDLNRGQSSSKSSNSRDLDDRRKDEVSRSTQDNYKKQPPSKVDHSKGSTSGKKPDNQSPQSDRHGRDRGWRPEASGRDLHRSRSRSPSKRSRSRERNSGRSRDPVTEHAKSRTDSQSARRETAGKKEADKVEPYKPGPYVPTRNQEEMRSDQDPTRQAGEYQLHKPLDGHQQGAVQPLLPAQMPSLDHNHGMNVNPYQTIPGQYGMVDQQANAAGAGMPWGQRDMSGMSMPYGYMDQGDQIMGDQAHSGYPGAEMHAPFTQPDLYDPFQNDVVVGAEHADRSLRSQPYPPRERNVIPLMDSTIAQQFPEDDVNQRGGGAFTTDRNEQGTKLFIGNLDTSINEETLRRFFQKHNFKVTRVMMSPAGRPFCFIYLSSEPEALRAAAQLDKAVLNGRRLTVQRAKMRPGEGQPGDFHTVASSVTGNPPMVRSDEECVLITNIGPKTSRASIADLCERFGTARGMASQPAMGNRLGSAVVRMSSGDEAREVASQVQNYRLLDSTLKVLYPFTEADLKAATDDPNYVGHQ